MKLSIVIKSYNEQNNIRACVNSVILAAKNLESEIVLVDSLSTDRTVSIAKQFPIRILQLAKPSQRTCGCGFQIGYQNTTGEYVLLIDGDMTLNREFPQDALNFLDRHKNIAGVGAVIREVQGGVYNQAEQTRFCSHKPWPTDYLCGIAVYRRKSIDKLGFLNNPYLYSGEDADLGFRLKSQQQKMLVLPVIGANHFRHVGKEPLAVLITKFRSKYFHGDGQTIRYNLNNRRVFLMHIKRLRISFLSLFLQGCLFISVIFTLKGSKIGLIGLGVIACFLLLLIARKRSVSRIIYSLIAWLFHGWGLLLGLLLPKQEAMQSNLQIRVVK